MAYAILVKVRGEWQRNSERVYDSDLDAIDELHAADGPEISGWKIAMAEEGQTTKL